MELNKKLEFVNKHHLCQIEEHKSDIAKLKQENVDLRVLMEVKPQDFDQRLAVKTREIKRLTQQLKKKEEESEKFVRQHEELKEQKQALIKSLDNSHQLVDQQVKCNEQNISDIQHLESELKTLDSKYKILTEKYDSKAADYDRECSDHQAALTEWKTQEESLSSRLRSLQKDHEALMKAHGDLEDLNSSWAQRNMNLLEDIKELKEKYEKETIDQSVQTEDNVTSAATQTEEDVIGRIADLEKTVLTKDENIQSLKDKVDFFEEIAKGAGHLKETIEELRAGLKSRDVDILELSKSKSEVDQLTQTNVATSDESAQTSQELMPSNVMPSANTVPPVDNPDDMFIEVGTDPSPKTANTQTVTESAVVMVTTLKSVEKSETSNINSGVERKNQPVKTFEEVVEHSEIPNTGRNCGNVSKSKISEPTEDTKKVVDHSKIPNTARNSGNAPSKRKVSEPTEDIKKVVEHSEIPNTGRNSGNALKRKISEPTEDIKKVVEHSEIPNTGRNSGNALKRKISEPTEDIKKVVEHSEIPNTGRNSGNALKRKISEPTEDIKKVVEHSEIPNTGRNSGNALKRKISEPTEDIEKVVASDTKSQNVAAATLETKSRNKTLGTDSQVKYLVSRMQFDLREKDETFHSQELNEALHSRLRKKVAMLKGETEKDSALKSLNVLSNRAPRKDSPRNRGRLLGVSSDSSTTTKPGPSSSPKTGSNGPSHAASGVLKSPLASIPKLGVLRSTLATTVSKPLTKPEPIYANSQQGFHSPPVMASPVIVSPSIMVGNKDNSAFSSFSRNLQTLGISDADSPKVASSIRMVQVPTPRLPLSTSEHSNIGKRKCMELGAGDTADLNGKVAPIASRDGEGEEPKANTSGILLDPFQSRQKLAKRVRFESQTSEQSFEEHWSSIQTVFNDNDEDCNKSLPVSAIPAPPVDGEDLLFSDDEEEMLI